MKLVIHRNLQQAQVIEATRVVVEDDLGNPIAFALEYAPGMIIAEVLREGHEAEFNHMLREMGISKLVVVDPIQTTPLPGVRFDE